MSYSIYLKDPVTKETIDLDAPHQMKGGTYALGGSSSAQLNITYNYSRFYYETICKEQGIRRIYMMSGAQSIPILNKAIEALGDESSDDYWAPLPGNAKKALYQLKALAELRPDGVWDGD